MSDDHSKLGSRSLKWSWSSRRGGSLTIDTPVEYLPINPGESSVSSFVFWVYSPQVLDGELTFTFYRGQHQCCSFAFRLGFTGWRGAWVAFDRDMTGEPEQGMDRIVVSASKGLKSGTLYFDGIIPAAFEDVRYHTAGWQAPFINAGTDSHWLVLNQSWDLRLDVPQVKVIDADFAPEMSTITSRFIELAVEDRQTQSYETLLERFNSYGIHTVADGTVMGLPIFFTRYGETFINLGIPDASKRFERAGELLRDYNDFTFEVALAWYKSTDESERKSLEGMYIALTEHLLDQGFAAGSEMGTLHHLGYSMKNFYTAPVIMRAVLRDAGLLEPVQQAMEWFSGVGEVKVAPQVPGMDIDAFNTSLMGRLASILMLEDSPYKQSYMRALSRWINNGFEYVDGTKPCFKEDGSVAHHRKGYPDYAVGGFNGAVNAAYLLSGTQFRVSTEGYSRLKKALLEMRFYSNLRAFPLALSGRHPDGKWALTPWHYARLALAAEDGVDEDLAAAYLRLKTPKDRDYEQFAHISAESSPTGTHYYPYLSAMTHRGEDWSVTFAGHSRYLWATEIYNGCNLYGRYLTHGSEQIIADGQPRPSVLGSGYQVAGWDWCHIPGTTAAVLPMEQMHADVRNVDSHSGYEEMLLSDESFDGGVTYGGHYGLYSFILHEHDKYNGSLRARKSYFAFGNRVVALGTGLQNSLEGSKLHTTLFQNVLSDEQTAQVANEEARAEGSMEYRASVGAPSKSNGYLQDRFGNAYFVQNGQAKYEVGLQFSYHEETAEPTHGYFEKAYIDHGSIVHDGSYEYLTLIHPTSSQLDSCSTALPYEVLRVDNEVHALRDCESGVVAMSVFGSPSEDYQKYNAGAATLLDIEGSPVLTATSSLIMYHQDAQDLNLSISNPDLALYYGPADEVYDSEGHRVERSVYAREWVDNDCLPTYVDIELDGLWNISSMDYVSNSEAPIPCDCATVTLLDDGHTLLHINTTASRTYELHLVNEAYGAQR